MLELRPYQKEAVDSVMAAVGKVKNVPKPVVVQAPTAFGKSVVIADLASKLGRVLVLSPSKEITEQNMDKLLKVGISDSDISICSASMKSRDVGGTIVLGTIGTVKKYYEQLKDIDAVIIDECHMVCCDNASTQYISFLDKLATNKIIGLTATPWRNCVFHRQFDIPKVYCRPITRIYMQGGKKTRFGEWFWSGGVIYRCSISDLQRDGYLSPIHYMRQKTDWSFLSEPIGKVDYDIEEMNKWTLFDENCSIFERAMKWTADNCERTLVFTSDINSSMLLCEIAKAAGISATTIDSQNDDIKTREKKLEDFRNGKIKVIFNVGVLTTGYDLPSLDCIVMCRPTKSLSLYLQMIGRSIRIDKNKPNKVARVIDMTDNIVRFGRVENILLGRETAVSPKFGNLYERDCIRVVSPISGKTKILDRVA